MSNQDELDFQLIDENDDSQSANENEVEETSNSDDKSKKEEATDTSPARKSNKSNFKKINKLNKALIAENKRLKEKLSTTKTSSDDFDDDDDDDISFDRNEFRFFLIENPEAKEYSKEIENTINLYPNLSFEDALALAKAKQPKKSQSSDDFSTKSVNTKVRKRLSELTEEEALKLDNSKYLEWARTTWKIK